MYFSGIKNEEILTLTGRTLMKKKMGNRTGD
jgi:hypothetical protein